MSTSKQIAAFADDADFVGRWTVDIKEMFVETEKELEHKLPDYDAWQMRRG